MMSKILPKLRSKLDESGLRTVEDLVAWGPVNISNITGLDIHLCEEICKRSEAIIGERDSSKSNNAFRTAADIYNQMSMDVTSIGLSTGSKNIDSLLGGHGIEFGAVTQLYGESGTGKTQLCHTLCGILSQHYKAVFMDTEHTFQPERILSIAEARNLDPPKLKNIRVVQPGNSAEQEQYIREICSDVTNRNIKLVIVDSMTSHYRADYMGRQHLLGRQKSLSECMHKLQRVSHQNNIAVYIFTKPYIFIKH